MNNLYGYNVVSSTLAIKENGHRYIEKTKTWKERIFGYTDYNKHRIWNPFESKKLIRIINYEPCIIRIGTTLYVHPSLMSALETKFMGIANGS